VDEQGWLIATDPQALVRFLVGRASERKLRLFAAACCRRIWHLLDTRAQEALEVAERFADGHAGDGERTAARKAAQQAAQSRAVTRRPLAPKWQRRAASAVYYATARAAEASSSAPQLAVEALIWQAGGDTGCDARAIRGREQAAQASALRDIVGTPFGGVRVEGAWVAWQDGLIPGLARAVYEERDPENGLLDRGRLLVLADALEEAGCCDPDILGHCRQASDHYRGCVVVDALLGKS
jgi:hypothetical protein